jgi:tripeptidyl-peptidase-1
VDGAVAPTNVMSAGSESDLDFQISYPLLYPQNTVLFQTDDPVYEANYTYTGFFNNFLDAIDGSYCSTISPLDPPYPDPAPGGYKGSLQCGKYTPVSTWKQVSDTGANLAPDKRHLHLLRCPRGRSPNILPKAPM